MNIFFSVGEPSGDEHGAKLIQSLRKMRHDINCVGYGGPKMKAAGCRLHEDLTQYAVMFVTRVLMKIPVFVRLLRDTNTYFKENKVDGVVLIDYPGFNWWVARFAKHNNIPVFYYGAPQMWAWLPWRVRKMRKFVDYVLCQLPFEPDWYAKRNCSAKFVGHPFFDEVSEQILDEKFIATYGDQQSRILTVLPGSRASEVSANTDCLLAAAEIVQRRHPSTVVAVACFNDKQASFVRKRVADRNYDYDVLTGRTPELIHLANACLACSGSVSLQLLAKRKPAVIFFKLGPIAYLLQKVLIRVKYITLVNLFWTNNIARMGMKTFNPDAKNAEPVPMPEYLTCKNKPGEIAGHVNRWFSDPDALENKISQLDQLAITYANPGASERTAIFILANLEETQVRESVELRRAA